MNRLCALLALLVGCGPAGLKLEQLTDLSVVEDQGSTCAGEAVAGFGVIEGVAHVGAVTTDGELLYVFFRDHLEDVTTLRILDVTAPDAVQPLGVLELPGIHGIEAASVRGGLLLAGWGRQTEWALAIDVSDPSAPVLGGKLELGRSGDATTFAFHGDRAFTDGGDVHAIDVSSPSALSGESFGGRAYAAPLVRDGRLFSGDWDGILGESCWLGVYDPVDVPVEVQRVDLDVCVRSALVSTGAGIVGTGFQGGAPVAVGFSETGGVWEATEPLPLDRFDMDRLAGAAGLGDGAVVVGGDGYRYGLILVAPDGDGLTQVASWRPAQGFSDSVAVVDGLAWTTFKVESGAFTGVVAVDFSSSLGSGGCP